MRGVCVDHYHKAMKFFVVQVNEVYLYFYKLKFEIMANTTTIECVALYYLADKKDDDYVCKDNFCMKVDANSLTVKSLTGFVMSV